MSYVVHKHVEGPAAAFNHRLVSSTPDPERLEHDYDDDLQMVPEHDFGPGSAREGEATELLSDVERMRLRQQLDAHLIEEALTSNKQFQQAIRQLTARQQQQKRKADQALSAAPPSYSVATTSSPSVTQVKGMVPVSIPVTLVQAGATHRPSASQGEDVRQPQPTSAVTSKMATEYGPCKYADTAPQPQASPGTTWAHWSTVLGQGSTGRPSDIGTFQHYVDQEPASVPPAFRPQGSKERPSAQHTPSSGAGVAGNISMGFTPMPSRHTGPFSGSTNSGGFSGPLNVAVDEEEEEGEAREERERHLATPACSPVRSRSSQPTSARPPFKPAGQSSTTSKSGLLVPVSKPLQKSSKGQAGKVPGAKKTQRQNNSKSDDYTVDGYYINRSDDDTKENGDESTPRLGNVAPAFYPSPFHKSSSLTASPESGTSSPSPAMLNQNNSATHLNTNQNMNNGDAFPSPRYASPAYYDQGGMGEMEDGEGGYDVSGATELGLQELQRLYANPQVKHGPRNIRKLLSELKQTVAIQGDLETCHLVQQLAVVVDTLPQLRVNFNLPVEIALHQQPYIAHVSQLNRRIRILNMQLKERERVEKEGLHPSVQAEMLSMQSESMELHQRLVETEKRCHELAARNSALEQEVKQLKTLAMQKDHEQLLSRQDMLHQLGRVTQELDAMALRNRSLTERLSAADNHQRILELNLRQREMDLHQLHDLLGNYKQAVRDVLMEGELNYSNSNLRSKPSFRLIHHWLQSSAPNRQPDYSHLSSSSKDPLDMTGNQRTARPTPNPTPSQQGKDGGSGLQGSQRSGGNKESDAQLYDFFLKPRSSEHAHSKDSAQSKDTSKDLSQSQDMSHSKGGHSMSEYTLLKETLGSTGQAGSGRAGDAQTVNSDLAAPSPLTMAAVAAHDQRQQRSLQATGDPLSRSWGGEDKGNHSPKNVSLPYHSDPEVSRSTRVGAPKPPSLIHQWKVGVERHSDTESLKLADKSDASLKQGNMSLEEASLAASRKSQGEAAQGKDHSEPTSTAPRLSEFPLSEQDAQAGSSRHSLNDYFTKYPSARPVSNTHEEGWDVSSSPSEATITDAAVTPSTSRHSSQPATKPSPQVSSPNHSLTLSLSETTQKDYFQGTELDLTLSTIPEDGSSTLTTLTGVSINSAAIAANDRKFRQGVDALDQHIVKVKESLSKLRKNFS